MQFKQFQISLDKLQLAPELRDLSQAEKRIMLEQTHKMTLKIVLKLN